jgi:hypothetical protein
VHSQDSLAARSRNTRFILSNYMASKPAVEAKACHVGLEDPQMQSWAGCSCRELTGDLKKKPLTYSLTTSLRANMEVVYEASPDGVEITIAADERVYEPSRIASNID